MSTFDPAAPPQLIVLLNWTEVARILLCFSLLLLLLKYKRQNETRSASFKKKLQQQDTKQMPSPPAMPLIGHIHLLREHQANPWEGFNEIRRQFGDVVSLKMGVHQMALVSSSDAMAEILLKKGDIFSDRPNFQRHHIIFGGDKENSLALCDWSNTHRDRRKFCKRGIVPNKFSSRNQLLEEIIIRHIRHFDTSIKQQRPQQAASSNLDSNAQQQQQPPSSWPEGVQMQSRQLPAQAQLLSQNYFKITKENLLFLTSDIFMEFLCHESHSHSSAAYKDFVLGCDFVFYDINQCYLIDFLPFLTSLGVGFSYLKRVKSVTDFLRGYIDDKIFDPRLEKYSKSDHYKSLIDDSLVYANDDDYRKPNEDYLDSIILEHLTNKTSMSLADYKVGFADLLAGHAAVANILTRLLGHLALDQSVQDMICQEVAQVELDKLNHMPALPVTEAALQEALRLASSPIVPHVAREDTSIDKFYTPQGTVVLFNNYHLNLSETLWTEPTSFNPRRFLKLDKDGSFKLDKPKHFMPFSAGLRQCLGYKMVESTTILAVANLCKEFIIKANNENLVRKLVAPKGSVALDPDSECFELNLYPR